MNSFTGSRKLCETSVQMLYTLMIFILSIEIGVSILYEKKARIFIQPWQFIFTSLFRSDLYSNSTLYNFLSGVCHTSTLCVLSLLKQQLILHSFLFQLI